MRIEDMICGKCVYHRKHPNGEWYCNNDNSEAYMCETGWDDSCTDGFEER